MNEQAYDISHLLSLEAVAGDLPTRPTLVARAAPPAAVPVFNALEDVLMRELKQAAAAHDAMVAEYLESGMVPFSHRDWYQSR